MLYRDRARAGSFGEDAEQYDRSRPTYPPAMVDDLMVDTPRDVLDVGAGTGIAARLFVDRGCEVLGVEPDARMAAVARSRGLRVEESTFEAWDPAGRVFDLAISGQAWHWVDPDAGSRKLLTVLRPGDRVGLFWNRGVPPESLRREMDEVYDRLAPGVDAHSIALGNTGTERVDEAAKWLRSTGRFQAVTIASFRHDITYTTAAWLDQLPTHSDHRAMDPARLEQLLGVLAKLIDDAGGRFVMAFTTWLVTAVAG